MSGSRAILVVPTVLAGCAGPMSSLDPAGPAAARIAELSWLYIAVTLVPAALVIALLLYGVRRARRARPDGTLPLGESGFIVAGGVALPLVILLLMTFTNVRTTTGVARAPAPAELVVEVIGHQYWWEIRYPDHGVVTANEAHIPVGTPVELRLTTADVIHSFWVPRLHGKTDMTPGHRTTTWLLAETPGAYRGQCAEFCGMQHALMALLIVAQPRADFAAWVERMRATPAPPTDEAARRGRDVFHTACAPCHAVRGVHEPRHTGAVGPDLTHLASRRTLAAATLPNTRENLAAFILDPHARKPGVRMPPTALSSDGLTALLAYLGTLR